MLFLKISFSEFLTRLAYRISDRSSFSVPSICCLFLYIYLFCHCSLLRFSLIIIFYLQFLELWYCFWFDLVRWQSINPKEFIFFGKGLLTPSLSSKIFILIFSLGGTSFLRKPHYFHYFHGCLLFLVTDSTIQGWLPATFLYPMIGINFLHIWIIVYFLSWALLPLIRSSILLQICSTHLKEYLYLNLVWLLWLQLIP